MENEVNFFWFDRVVRFVFRYDTLSPAFLVIFSRRVDDTPFCFHVYLQLHL